MRNAAILIAVTVGLLTAASLFLQPLEPLARIFGDWFVILSALAFFVGAANLVVFHLKKVSEKEAGWGFSLVTLLAFAVTSVVGILKVGVPPAEAFPNHPWSGAFVAEGSWLWWIFEYTIQPLAATMFSLLAFYVASAAFRAFRAKTAEASVLLLTAIIVLIDRSGDGAWLTSDLPPSLSGLTFSNLTLVITAIFNTAGQRAIMIGIALGVAATSLRILLGMDRPYASADD